MNCFILLPHELMGGDLAVLRGARVDALRATVAPHANEVKVALWGGARGIATVTGASAGELRLHLTLDPVPLPRDPTILIVGISRPQTVKKVVQAATLLGAKELHFVRAASAEKSYLDATVMRDAALEAEVQEGLAQAWDGIGPRISVHERFNPFVQDLLPQMISAEAIRWLPDVKATAGLAETELPATDVTIVAAIGPEAGWNEYELKQFKEVGFQPLSFGPRILRVETAVTVVLAQAQLLRKQRQRR